jgi:phosphoglycolate phosphatase-like HAD superfamily hydrolase
LRAAERLGARIEQSIVIGDSVWDLLAARRAGAYRVYDDPAGLLAHLDEVGIRDPES